MIRYFSLTIAICARLATIDFVSIAGVGIFALFLAFLPSGENAKAGETYQLRRSVLDGDYSDKRKNRDEHLGGYYGDRKDGYRLSKIIISKQEDSSSEEAETIIIKPGQRKTHHRAYRRTRHDVHTRRYGKQHEAGKSATYPLIIIHKPAKRGLEEIAGDGKLDSFVDCDGDDYCTVNLGGPKILTLQGEELADQIESDELGTKGNTKIISPFETGKEDATLLQKYGSK